MAKPGESPGDDEGEGTDLPEHHDEILATEEALKFHAPGKAKAIVMKAFGISPRTADRRIAQVKAAWANIRDEIKPIAKAQARRLGMQLLTEARDHEQYAAAGAIWANLCKLDGLNEPAEFRDRTEKVVDLSKLTDDELATHVRLMRKASGEPAPEE